MPRQRQIECEGAVSYVLSMGDRREAVFIHAQDRQVASRGKLDLCLQPAA